MANSDNYGLIDSNDLLSSGELLPDGTRIFASHYTYTRLFWKLGFTTLGVVFLCFIGVVGCHVSTPAGSVFLCLFFVFLLVGLCLMYWTHTQDLQKYNSLSSAGAWMEGIVVFQNGTVVYRTKSLFENTEVTMDMAEIEDVQLTHSYSLWRQLSTCGGKGEPDRQFVHFTIAPRRSMGTNSLSNRYIDCSEIKEDGDVIVAYIKEIQLKTSPSLISY